MKNPTEVLLGVLVKKTLAIPVNREEAKVLKAMAKGFQYLERALAKKSKPK